MALDATPQDGMALHPLAHRKVDTAEFFRMLRDDVAPLRFQPEETRTAEWLAMWANFRAAHPPLHSGV